MELQKIEIQKDSAPKSPAPFKDTTPYIYDTAKTLCTYMINLATGECPTAYLIRITKSRMDFVQPSPEELKRDSLTLKKQKVVVSSSYFMPLSIADKVIKKGDKPKYHTEYAYMSNDMIIKDYGGNLDYVLKQIEKNGIPIPQDSVKLKKTNPKKK